VIYRHAYTKHNPYVDPHLEVNVSARRVGVQMLLQSWKQAQPILQKWDVGKPTVAFSQFLDGGFLATQGKVAYVPGCG